jgi:hypothetical protein
MPRLPSMFFAALGAGAVLVPAASAESYAPRVGQRHVEFTLPSIHDGKPVSLAQFRGKKVLLIQFASW